MTIERAMILAAGMGSRMRHLTQHTPKALLTVLNKPLIVYHLEKIAACGIKNVVINVSYLGEQIQSFLGDGHQFGTRISYSVEPVPLETAGGIVNALQLLGEKPFLCINADVWTDFNFLHLIDHYQQLPESALADLVLINNPEHHLSGDFAIENSTLTLLPPLLTFSGISILHPKLFTTFPDGSSRLGYLLRSVIEIQPKFSPLIYGLHYHGQWSDVGTPERLMVLNAN